MKMGEFLFCIVSGIIFLAGIGIGCKIGVTKPVDCPQQRMLYCYNDSGKNVVCYEAPLKQEDLKLNPRAK
jgi:hypothetical protein